MGRQRDRRSPIRLLVDVTIAVSTIVTGPLVHQVSAQEEIAAAIVEGDCGNPGDVAADLRSLTVSEGGALTSFTTIDLAIDALTDGGYAIVAGEPDTPIACGDISGEGDDVYLALPARDDTELSGIAWLHARADSTQVSLFLGEDLDGATPAASSGPLEPPADETPEPAGQSAETVTYTSPSYGYSVTHDAELWTVEFHQTDPSSDGPIDYYILYSGHARAEFYGFAGAPWLSTLRILTNVYDGLVSDPERFSDVTIRDRGGDETKAFAIIDFTVHRGTDLSLEKTYHIVSWNVPGDAYATMLFEIPREEYDDWTAEREELEGGVAIPSK